MVGSGSTKEEMYNLIKEFRPKYVVVSIFLPQALNDPDREKFFIPAQNPDLFTPVLAFEPFLDQQRNIPILIVYEVNQEQINNI